MKFTKSDKLFEKALEYFPSGVQTASKKPENYYGMKRNVPLYFKSAKGAVLTDVDNNKFIDYISALGPVILGYNYPAVNNAVMNQFKKGVLTSFSNESEIVLAKKIRSMVPCAESIRFMKTGAEAASAAVKIARAYTKKDIVLMCGYLGWHDWANKGEGIPKEVQKLTYEFKFNDFDQISALIKKYGKKTACVIMEPVVLEEPKKGYLEFIKKLCRKNNIILIFDEIKTGFRLAKGGAQEHYGVIPDIAVFAKAMANGMPISAVAGRKHIMKILDKIWISSTYACEALSLSASLATLETIGRFDVPKHIEKNGKILMKGFVELVKKHHIPAVVSGLPSMISLRFTGSEKKILNCEKIFFRETLDRGILLKKGAYNFLSFSHTKNHIERTLNAVNDAFGKIKIIL